MERVLQLKAADLVRERQVDDDDIHFPSSLARAVIEEHSAPGGTVLDPFAGGGTTLAVAAAMGRRAIGVELLPERVAAIRRRVPAAVVHEADARRLPPMPVIDLCLTSPPYMTEVDHPHNPLTGYETLDGDYDTYLRELTEVFVAVARLLRPGGHLVINAATIRAGDHVTTLAWDIARELRPHVAFRGETLLVWDEPPHWLRGDYLLTFQRA